MATRQLTADAPTTGDSLVDDRYRVRDSSMAPLAETSLHATVPSHQSPPYAQVAYREASSCQERHAVSTAANLAVFWEFRSLTFASESPAHSAVRAGMGGNGGAEGRTDDILAGLPVAGLTPMAGERRSKITVAPVADACCDIAALGGDRAAGSSPGCGRRPVVGIAAESQHEPATVGSTGFERRGAGDGDGSRSDQYFHQLLLPSVPQSPNNNFSRPPVPRSSCSGQQQASPSSRGLHGPVLAILCLVTSLVVPCSSAVSVQPTARAAAPTVSQANVLPASCFFALQACDFVFNKSLGFVPLYLLAAMQPDVPFSEGIIHSKRAAPILSAKLKPHCKAVNVWKSKSLKCPPLTVVPPTSSSPSLRVPPCPSIRFASKTQVSGTPGYNGACFTMSFSQLMVKLGSGPKGILRLTSGDGNTQFPEARRCVVFKTL